MCACIYPYPWLLFCFGFGCVFCISFTILLTVCFSFSVGRYLISQGAHVGAVNSEGDTPLDIAEEEAMEELLQNEVNRQGNLESEKIVLCVQH